MCFVIVDLWICPACNKAFEECERIQSWETCDEGPTYDKACPNFNMDVKKHYEYYCPTCEAARQVLDQAQREEQQRR
ncbi:hypothetical protein PG989_010720 [Apiospora arundinis]|uniref:Uncharacterized protein n=1 Tax=Apiospora arundinis TaxID=335852 RepID=A0ABR2HQI5_9PEZI